MPWEAAVAEVAELDAVPVPFDHPMWVLFSSGTTGLPKGLVHGHGGFLVETLKQVVLHWDLDADDRLFWYTSPSWVMWNLQLSALVTGGSILCYDGSPTHPDASRLWQLVADHGVTFFGTSPGYLQASANDGLHPAKDLDLSRLRAMGSTGSPLAPYLHRWARDEVGDLPLWSMSGGTDIAAAFVGGAPTVPIWPGEISVRCLGVAMEAWDENGEPVYDEVGELVVHRPMPSMPVFLWDDPDGSRYVEAYFSTFPGAWRQGDWITVTERGSVVIHGRSDSTLNRNGVRMGSADIYAAVETIPEVTEALVIGAEQSDGTYWMPLFVVLAEGCELDDAMVARIRDAIRSKASPRHVPDEVIAVPGIPHTRTGKKLEVPVKRILQGVPLERVANPDAVDDAGLLAPFVDLAARRSP
jgi:acetoacetyl-CoA synthetase